MYFPESWGSISRCRVSTRLEISRESLTNLNAPIYEDYSSTVNGYSTLIIHLSGDVSYSNAYHSYDADVLDMVSFGAGEVYGIHWGHKEAYDRYVIYFDREIFKDAFLENPEAENALMSFLNRKKQPNLIKLSEPFKDELIGILNGIEPLFGREDVDMQIQTFLGAVKIFTLMYRIISSDIGGTVVSNHVLKDTASKAMQYINKSFKDISHISQIADYLHVSPGYLSKCFKKNVGMSVKDYVLDKKLAYSKHLISLGQNVTEASISAGFASASHFIQLYKKKYGVTPGRSK